MSDQQRANKPEKVNGAETPQAEEKSPAAEAPAPCGCCGGKNKKP